MQLQTQISGKPALLIGRLAEYCPVCRNPLSFDFSGKPFCRGCQKRARAIIEGRKIKWNRR